MSYLDNLTTARDALAKELASLDLSKITYSVEDRTFQFDGHLREVRETLRYVNEALRQGQEP